MPDVGAFPEVVRLAIDGTYHRFAALIGNGDEKSTRRRREETRGQLDGEEDTTQTEQSKASQTEPTGERHATSDSPLEGS